MTKVTATTPRVHVARSPAVLGDGKIYHYAYLRYEVWDPKKGRYQPKQLASLGRTDRLDEGRLESMEGFLKEWLRKDSSLPFEALKERFKAAEPTIQILCSRDFGLRWIIEQAWEELGYKEALAEIADLTLHEFRVDVAVFAMVLAQLVAPQSKRGLAEWKGADLFFPEGAELTVKHMYASMDVLGTFYSLVEKKLKEKLDELEIPVTTGVHDTTTLPFAIRYDDVERAELEERRQASGKAQRPGTVNDPPLRMRGHAKNKRPDLPQVVIEAVIQENNLVLHHETHAGNTRDTSLTPETLRVLQDDLGYVDLFWAGDAGTNTVKNRQALRAVDFEFVLGEGVARTKVVKEVLKAPGTYHPHPEKPDLSYKCVVREATDERGKGKNAPPGPQRLYVVRRNRAEEEDALRRIDAHLEKVKEVLSSGTPKKREGLLHHKTYRCYVKPDPRFKAKPSKKKGADREASEEERPAGAVVLAPEKVAQLRLQAGKSVIATDSLEANPIEVDELYRHLFEIERVFRQLKATLRVGPIRHRRADRIKAHVMIGIMAHNIAAWIEHKSGLTLEQTQRRLRNLRVQEVQMGEATYWQCVELEAAQKALVEKLGYELPPQRFTVSLPESP